MPHGLRGLLSGHQVETAHHMGWDRLTNGDLLTAAEAGGFAVFITADRNIRYQQNLAGRQISIIELSTSHRDTIRDDSSGIISAFAAAHAGSYVMVPLPRPPRRRRRTYPPDIDDAPPGPITLTR
jgi:hypothetical protein